MAAAVKLPRRSKMFTEDKGLTPDCLIALNHIRAKHPTMKPEVPPLTSAEKDWLLEFVDEWAKQLEGDLTARRHLPKYRK
jgi:hypothetical protein